MILIQIEFLVEILKLSVTIQMKLTLLKITFVCTEIWELLEEKGL